MKDESAPITPDEFVIRLIWGDFYRPDAADPVRERAFRPRPDETDGISVFRAACLNDPRDVLSVLAPEKQGKYALALLPVAEVVALGLTVLPSVIHAVPGHGVIPELTIAVLTNDSVRCRNLQRQLAAIAARYLIPPAGGPTT